MRNTGLPGTDGRRSKMIKDPVHGDIEVDKGIRSLLDTPPVQRLRMIRQLGFSFLVYPGANHSRFEHALGTMHLATHLCRRLSLSKDETLLLRAAALLHDIGHGPFRMRSSRYSRHTAAVAMILYLICWRTNRPILPLPLWEWILLKCQRLSQADTGLPE